MWVAHSDIHMRLVTAVTSQEYEWNIQTYIMRLTTADTTEECEWNIQTYIYVSPLLILLKNISGAFRHTHASRLCCYYSRMWVAHSDIHIRLTTADTTQEYKWRIQTYICVSYLLLLLRMWVAHSDIHMRLVSAVTAQNVSGAFRHRHASHYCCYYSTMWVAHSDIHHASRHCRLGTQEHFSPIQIASSGRDSRLCACLQVAKMKFPQETLKGEGRS